MNITVPLLSTIIWLPIIAGAVMLLWPMRYLPIIVSIISLGLCISLGAHFDASTWQMQHMEHIAWVSSLKLNYTLGVDGISLLLVLLTVFMTFLVNIVAFTQVDKKQFNAYCAAFIIMQGLMCGVFFALDAVLFYVFFEAMMIPMFLIIGLWGGPERVYATFKFILYTFFGSLFLLVSILYLGHLADSFSILDFHKLSVGLQAQRWLFWAMLFAFAVKVPMWPVHTWLPDAHTEAPTGGSVILAAITLKMGAYGMLRFMLPVLPMGCAFFAGPVIILSLIAIGYIGLVAIIQKDMKKLIAYSSIAHMGFVTLGMFIAFKMIDSEPQAVLGLEGAIIQMLSHGLVSGALFFCVGALYVRMHTRMIDEYGGVANVLPLYAAFFMLFALANVGLPGTSGFVGEFMVILASFRASPWYAFFAATTLVLGASYTLWMYKRVVFGDVTNKLVSSLQVLTVNERIVFTLLAVAILLIGVWPNLLLYPLHEPATHLVQQMLNIR